MTSDTAIKPAIERTEDGRITSVFGRELELMLTKHKPMSAFCRFVHEDFDEKGGQDFSGAVRAGLLSRYVFYLPATTGRIVYTVYCLKGHEWRFPLYKAAKTVGQHLWNDELERLEGWLLGYTGLAAS